MRKMRKGSNESEPERRRGTGDARAGAQLTPMLVIVSLLLVATYLAAQGFEFADQGINASLDTARASLGIPLVTLALGFGHRLLLLAVGAFPLLGFGAFALALGEGVVELLVVFVAFTNGFGIKLPLLAVLAELLHGLEF